MNRRLQMWVFAACLMFACGEGIAPVEQALLPTASETDTPPSETAPEPSAAPARASRDLDWTGAPWSARTLAQRLRARHAADLPTEVDPAAARWVATHDRWLVIRARALSMLRDDSEATHALIADVLDDEASHPVLLSAAVAAARASSSETLAARAAEFAEHPDPRVRHAAR
jgi:hypothetical protein